ncbi:YqaA family protein [Mesorhizobium sp.]|uniref:YqaA family protein n=1 Tax=Mesorhizobium sp. TaxID=1871066 RepID=UPI000FE555CA|nr:YqaA family protein [Mesorhizobium sp.]RWI29412.1 MAG: DedA family protein [Mesorhizobium sp.]RWK52374.1 MAG: DedA family protein [Mesorhizobium sp.]RWK97436.1 MAG: DedA family protein [Mesorhizobium sp.]TIP56744.1 MAG: DedA family protein [Mesorhizobium sp.]TIP99157.1 MAG: DedA family protein [Mesorhizobium sp.]
MDDFAVYGGLFLVAFAAATILPAQSEAALAGLLASGAFSPAMLVVVASMGNILGSAVNWGLGRGIERFRDEPWFPLRPARLNRATNWYHRYGRWSLLLSWMPIVGDPLTVVAGVLREPLWSFVAIVAVAKVSRYLLVAGAVLGLM